jgi:hypothetical protein
MKIAVIGATSGCIRPPDPTADSACGRGVLPGSPPGWQEISQRWGAEVTGPG